MVIPNAPTTNHCDELRAIAMNPEPCVDMVIMSSPLDANTAGVELITIGASELEATSDALTATKSPTFGVANV